MRLQKMTDEQYKLRRRLREVRKQRRYRRQTINAQQAAEFRKFYER